MSAAHASHKILRRGCEQASPRQRIEPSLGDGVIFGFVIEEFDRGPRGDVESVGSLVIVLVWSLGHCDLCVIVEWVLDV